MNEAAPFIKIYDRKCRNCWPRWRIWPFRARQCDSDRCSLDRSAFGLERDFLDFGIESPLLGLMRISGAPLRNALAQIDEARSKSAFAAHI
jgi:hypothetical protein